MYAFCERHEIEAPSMAQTPAEMGATLTAIAIAMVKELDEAKASLVENKSQEDGISTRPER